VQCTPLLDDLDSSHNVGAIIDRPRFLYKKRSASKDTLRERNILFN